MAEAQVTPRGVVVLVGVALLAGATAASIGALSLADALTATGLPDPGPVTNYGLPFVRGVGEIAAAIAVGSFLFAAFLVPAQDSGVLDAPGYRAVRLGAMAAGVWAVCAALLVALTISDVSGQPLREQADLLTLWSLAGLVDTADAWRWTALLAAAVAVGALPVLRWSPTPFLLLGALATLLPLALTGHSSSGGSHDVATDSLLIHVLAAALWAGGLLVLAVQARRLSRDASRAGRTPFVELAARRFSMIAGWCFLAVALSGVVNALVRIRPGDLLASDYGRLILVKVGALCVLGVLGWRQRRVGLTALCRDPSEPARLVRLALTEGLVFGVTFGVAVGLGRTPPPPPRRELTIPQVEIGYDFAGPPTWARLLFDWRFDLIFGTAAVVLAVVYVAAVLRLRGRGDTWPVGRTLAWLCGCAVLLVATSSGVGRYMPAMFSVHMAAHLLLSMLAPVLLALGGPVTLARRALSRAGRGRPPGLREWILVAVHGRIGRFLTHPIVATTVFVVGFYGWYVGGIFDAAAASHGAHVLMKLCFLVGGYLFFWVVIGIDPTPRPLPTAAKLGMVLASLPLHAVFGVLLMRSTTVLAEGFYRSLQLAWHTDLVADQRLGGLLAWAAGGVPLVAVMIVLLIRWRRRDRRATGRIDRPADATDAAELSCDSADPPFAHRRRG